MAEETKQVRKRNRPDLENFGQENVKPGDNSYYIRHALAGLNMPPIDISDPEQVSERITWYFNHCAEADMKPTVKGFCNALGVTRETLRTWRNGQFRAGTHQDIIVKAYNLLEELWETYLVNNKMNVVAAIFLGKNNFGYVDQQEHILTPNQTTFASEEEIAAKYDELPE